MSNKLPITRGRWIVKKSESKNAFNVVGTAMGGTYKIARCPYLVVPNNEVINEREQKEANANATLMADAGTTYNKCGLLPSDMLTQNEELIKGIENAEKVMKWMFDNFTIIDKTLQSDAFNVPANAITELSELLTKYQK